MSKIVITGIGTLSPHGIGKGVFWESLLSRSRGTDHNSPTCNRGGLIPGFDEQHFLDSKTIKYLQRAERLALISSQLALSDAKLDPTHLRELSVGVAIGSIASNLRAAVIFDWQVLCGEPSHIDPSLVPSGIMNSLSGNVSIKNGLKGFHVPVSAGESSAIEAALFALMQLEAGRSDAVLAGGVDEIFHERNLKTGSICVLSEGAAMLVIEPLTRAVERNVEPYAECAGLGFSYSAKGYSNRENYIRAASEAMKDACRDARIAPSDIDLVFASADAGTVESSVEMKALDNLFVGRPAPPTVCTKSALGESLAASGAFQIAAAALAIKSSVIPPAIKRGKGGSDPGADLRGWKETHIANVLINSFSTDGHVNCLLLSKV